MTWRRLGQVLPFVRQADRLDAVRAFAAKCEVPVRRMPGAAPALAAEGGVLVLNVPPGPVGPEEELDARRLLEAVINHRIALLRSLVSRGASAGAVS